MRRVLLTLVLSLTVVGASALAPATSSAKVAVGIGEQKVVFQNPLFTQLHTKRVRYVAPWNVALKSKDRARFNAWYKSVRKAHQEPLVSFSAATGSRCPRRPCRLPSVKSYTKAFKSFRKRYRKIKVISVWNEINHRTQPTFKKPKRAAQYFNAVRKRCRGCKIVAADVIDETNMVRYVKKFKRYARKPKIWGLHNYRDTNPRKKRGKTTAGGTRRLLKATRRGQVWMTETGGLVFFRIGHSVVFKRSNSRANKAIKRMFRLAKRYRKRIRRLYIYQFQAPAGNTTFDAGLVAANGVTKRPGYNTVKKTMRQKRYFTR
jgi:hypothetical protein